jgi:AraC-like DNA-binding protein
MDEQAMGESTSDQLCTRSRRVVARVKRTRLLHHRALPWPAGLPSLHALLAPVVAYTFGALRISAVLRDETQWYPIHVAPQPLLAFELEHGKEMERRAYNDRFFRRVYREKKAFRGEHAGFSDLFVPIAGESRIHAILVTGPFLTARPTSEKILQCWHWLTGRPGHRSDPDFVQYVATTLGALRLDGDQLGRFERFSHCLATISAGRGDAHALAAEAAALGSSLEQARFIDVMWEAVRSMVDERTVRGWSSTYRINELADLGLSQVPEHVLAGLLIGRRDEPDPVGEMLQRDDFQRACVDLARLSKNVVSGRIGEHGVVFLLSGPRTKRDLAQLGDRVAGLARRRFGLTIHLGTSSPGGSLPLSARYEQALGAAESALSQGFPFVVADALSHSGGSPLRRLREQLGTVTQDRPDVLVTRFERYIEAVSVECGYRLEAVRAHLDAGFDRAAHALARVGVVEPRSQEDMYQALDRAARDAPTVGEMLTVFRRAIADLVEAAEHPVAAAQDRNLRRALAFIEQHYTERIGLGQVARVAGFAPRYFSRLFRRREGTTFEDHVRRLRLERARQLLEGTDLTVERVAQLSGFALRPYFHRAFKRAFGETPLEHRRSKRSGM